MATKSKPPKKNTSNWIRLGLFWAIVVLGILTVFAIVAPRDQLKDVNISSVIERANKGEIEKIEGSGNNLKITPKGSDEPKESSYLQGGVSTLLRDDTLNKDVKQRILQDTAPSETGQTLWNLAIILVPVLLIVGFFMFMMRQAQGQNNQAMGFGKSKAKLYGTDKECFFSQI